MTRNKLILAGLGAALLVTNSLVADAWDKKTIITVNSTIVVPGAELTPGKYVLKLANSQSDRHIVQIFNEDQSKLITTVLAFNNYRLQPTGDTVLRYWETPVGTPPALRAWFYPGDNFGQEFAYPKDIATRLAQGNNNTQVPYYEGPAQPAESDLAGLTVHDYDQTKPTPPADMSASSSSSNVAVETAPQVESNNTVLAQNTPPPAPAAQPYVAPQPATPEPSPISDELPRTASSVPLVAAAGFVILGLAASLRLLKA